MRGLCTQNIEWKKTTLPITTMIKAIPTAHNLQQLLSGDRDRC